MRRLITIGILAGAIVLTLTSSVAAGLPPEHPALILNDYGQEPTPTTDNSTCLSCHQNSNLEMSLPDGSPLPLYVDPASYEQSVHGQEGVMCFDCHTNIGGYPHDKLPSSDRRQVALDLYTSCRRCHPDNYDKTLDSVHQRALAGGERNAAICTDCHRTHDVRRPEQLPRFSMAIACSGCHATIYNQYKESIHGSALLEENPDVPTCVDCHGVHNIPDPTTAEFRLKSPTEMCGKCHTDPDLMDKYGISTDVLQTYVADFHGTTVTLFEKQSPDHQTNKPVCFDCHGVHDIKAVDDPQKGLHVKENLLKSCLRCHPDATTNFPASWLSHYIPTLERAPLVFGVNLFYTILIPATLGGMFVLVALDAGRQIINRQKRQRELREMGLVSEPKEITPEGEKTYVRFSLFRRIEHIVLLISFTTLAVTGLPQKFSTNAHAQSIIAAFGGIELTRLIHHAAAIIMAVQSIYHIVLAAYAIYIHGETGSHILPGLEDLKHIIQSVQYNLGKRERSPFYGRYTYAEKMEYWAMVWGTIIMGITGFMLWNPITFTHWIPGELIPAAKAAHGAEAILAVLAILLWHTYHVHLKHFNLSIFTGRITEHEMLEEHPAELELIKSGKARPPLDRATRQRRRQIFFPLGGLLSAALLAGVYWFATVERTAITTIPPEPPDHPVAFVTATPTITPVPTITPTPEPVASQPTFNQDILPALQIKCGACHGQMGGLTLTSHESVMHGGATGPAVVPGDPDNSLLLTKAAGDHPGQFSPEEIALITAWIQSGALE